MKNYYNKTCCSRQVKQSAAGAAYLLILTAGLGQSLIPVICGVPPTSQQKAGNSHEMGVPQR
jgi:hypothetical protein